jgi:hypothetical protein
VARQEKLTALGAGRNVQYVSLAHVGGRDPPSGLGRNLQMPQRAIDSQFDFFPERVIVEALDPRAAAGGDTRVQAMYRVRYEREREVHQVFHDRHGWYCAQHGRECRAVREVTARRRRASES